MNIIYKLTNISKSVGPIYYIGSKTECNLVQINNVPTIVSLKTNKPYYGSSSCNIFNFDFKNGNIFKAEILEIVSDKFQLLAREKYYAELYNIVSDEQYYNLATPLVNGFYASDKIINIFGESLKEFSQNQSNWSKRKTTAEKLGYSYFSDLAFYIHEQSSTKSYAEISKSLGLHRHFAKQFIKNFNMPLASSQIINFNNELALEIKLKLTQGLSFKKACQLYNLEEPALEFILKDFNPKSQFSVALQRGHTANEFEKLVATEILVNDSSFADVALKHSTTRKTIERYFLNYVKKRLVTSDDKGTLML